ncbi:MAG: ABC transporter permease, partial [Candidatus Dormibacteraceae bacterium]
MIEHNLLQLRHTWRATLWIFISPFFFLIGMCWGVGSLVNPQAGGFEGISYLAFIAPGLLAVTAMQQGAMEGAWPILDKVMWRQTYLAMLSTPLGINQILLGEMSWLTLRLLAISLFFWLGMLGLGLIHTPWAILALPVVVLTGLAFAMPFTALSGVSQNDRIFILLFRIGIMPLFLLAGAFFPIDRLPSPLQSVAWLTPTFHWVAWARELILGTPQLPLDLLHLTVLLFFVGSGTLLARWTLSRRL